MKIRKKTVNNGFFDGLVVLMIVVLLCFTSVTVSSSMTSSDSRFSATLSVDNALNEKELQRVIATLNDDVCDDCDDDPDGGTGQNKKPVAFILQIIPNPAVQFDGIFFEGYGEDDDGTITDYRWESSIDGWLNSNATFTRDDLSIGVHTISFSVQDNQALWSDPVNITLEVGANQAPQPPNIIGSSKLKPGVEADFTIFTVDPEQHDVYYYIEWGDGSSDGWDGPFESNDQISFSHTWNSKGSYEIKAKAKDSYEAESSYGSFSVQMSKSKTIDDSAFALLVQRLIDRYPLFSFLIP